MCDLAHWFSQKSDQCTLQGFYQRGMVYYMYFIKWQMIHIYFSSRRINDQDLLLSEFPKWYLFHGLLVLISGIWFFAWNKSEQAGIPWPCTEPSRNRLHVQHATIALYWNLFWNFYSCFCLQAFFIPVKQPVLICNFLFFICVCLTDGDAKKLCNL